MKLKRSLDALRWSPRKRFTAINDWLKGMGFTSTTGPCVHTFGTSDTSSILTLHVDNLLLREGNTLVPTDLKCKLIERFTMTDMGHVSQVFGMQITRDREAGTLTIS